MVMALVRAQGASSGRQPFIYDVFLSFRGEDIRNTFVAHLYTALSGAGFRTFKDNDDGIARGENITAELEKAIFKEARSSIIVFSKDYTSSKWCLNELVMILQHNRTSGHRILPVFYHVDPSHVRNQTGGLAEAFCGHEERIKMETDEKKKEHLRNELEGWRAALKDVGHLAGMVLADQGNDESKFIQEIVKEVGKNVRSVLYVAPYIVGMEYRVKNIISWLEDDSDHTDIFVIYGIGGIGKTTITKYVYNLYFERFEASSFLADVRDRSKDQNGLIKLQRQLLSDVLGRKKERISNVDEGINRIVDAIGCKKVLFIIDDVDEREQLQALIGMRDFFHPGSKIILTTRRQDLLKANEGYKLHEVERFYDDESLELFSWHAFGQDHPIEGFINHSKRIVEYCGGNPLALEALASSLGGSSKEEWQSTLQKLETIQDSRILEKLKISYDNLPDDNVKNLFLHIACFFIRNDKDFTIKILDACGIYSISGMKILNRRSLLNFDEHNKLMMHQLLQDMGREIVRQESPDELGKRSRLWHHEDSLKVLKEKNGTERIKGLFLDMRLMEEDKHSNRSFRVRNTKRQRFKELDDNSSLANQHNSLKRLCSGFLSWLPTNMNRRNSHQEELKVDVFARIRNLKLLQLNYAEIKGRYKDFPKGLRLLRWQGFPLESLPSDFSVDFLVALDLRYSRLKQLWKGTKMLNSLKILNLSYCHDLANSPNFWQFPSLEELRLKDCTNLVEIHESIGKLGNLLLLNLRGCKNLKQLPMKTFEMKSLIVLILSGCSRLERFPSDLGKMESLKTFHADGINHSSSISPESFRFLLTSLPSCLVTLDLAKCNLSSDYIPWNLVDLCTLQELNLSKNPICSLPELPISLRLLNVENCCSLETLTILPNLSSQLLFNAKGCEKLVEVQGLFKLAPVDSKMVEELGLAHLDSDGMLQVPLMNCLTETKNHQKAPILQGLYECGIYNIFLRGRVIPNWITAKGGGRSYISFTIPSSSPNLKIRGLKVCVVFETYNIPYFHGPTSCIVVNNESRNLTAIYAPIFKICDIQNEDVTWLSYWKMADQLMGVGDRVNIWIENKTQQEVKDFEIQIVCDNNPTICHQDVDLDLSVYHINEGLYFLYTQFASENILTMLHCLGVIRLTTDSKAEEGGYKNNKALVLEVLQTLDKTFEGRTKRGYFPTSHIVHIFGCRKQWIQRDPESQIMHILEWIEWEYLLHLERTLSNISLDRLQRLFMSGE